MPRNDDRQHRCSQMFREPHVRLCDLQLLAFVRAHCEPRVSVADRLLELRDARLVQVAGLRGGCNRAGSRRVQVKEGVSSRRSSGSHAPNLRFVRTSVVDAPSAVNRRAFCASDTSADTYVYG